MILVGITCFLILIGLGFFAYGAIALSKYAFRLGTGPGLLTLLVPPYTIYFALFKLEEDGKSWPTASWLFGLVVTVLLCIAFYPDLSAVARGDMERFEDPEPASATAAETPGSTEVDTETVQEDKAEDKEVAAGADAGPATEGDAGAEAAAEGDAGQGDAGQAQASQ
jgi:hypothetical protein